MQDRAYYQSLLGNENVQRALATIREAEGTQRYANPYATGFGGYQIDDLSWHPGVSRPFNTTTGRRLRTTAAGAYQFLNNTWNNVAQALGLDDFSQENQDIAAVALMDERGALDNVLAGDVEGFTDAVNREWASMPGSPYDQNTRSRSFINRAWNAADPGLMSAMFDNVPTPEAAPRWETAVPGEVQAAELADVPSGLMGPSVTPSQGYGLLAETMGQTPSLNLSGATPASPMDRMSAEPVAQGLDGLRAGLLSQQPGSMYASQMEMSDMQARANLQNDVNEMRGHVTPQSAGLMSFAEATPSPSPAAAAIEAAAPAQPSAAALADAYGQLGQSLYEGGTVGLSGQKLYNMDAPMGELQGPGLLSSAPMQTTQQPAQELGDYQDPSVSVQGPATSTIQTAPTGPTPPADVGSFPAAPTTPGQTAKKVAGRVAGALLGGAALGPIGGLMGGLLGNELASGKGLFSRQPQSVGGLLSSMGAAINNIGQGAQQSYSVWGGGTPVGTQATATDGSKITSLGGGLIARTDPNGVTTTFNDRGNIVGSPVSTGGLFSGIGRDIADAFGGGGSSSGGTGVDTSGMSPGLW